MDIVSVILVQGFFPLKIEFTQFPDDFRLNTHQLRRSAMQILWFNFIFISPCFTVSDTFLPSFDNANVSVKKDC